VAKVDGPKARQRVLNPGTRPILPHREMGDRYVEELQDFQELLRRERALASLDFREAALRQPQPFGQIRLRPVPLLSQGPDFPGDLGSGFVPLESVHIDLSILLSRYQYFDLMNGNVKT
jgi:hypothetical protein